MNKPSKIQAVSIPLIVIEPYNNLIAFAPTGSGKTGAFAIGSVLRVDRKNPKCQVLVISNTRELCNQIHSVFEKIVKGTDITLANFAKEKNSKQIIVGTHGAVLALQGGRAPIDLSSIKCLIIDECDFFFEDDKNYEMIEKIVKYKHIQAAQPQYLLFSATAGSDQKEEQVQMRMSKMVKRAQQIKLSAQKSMSMLEHIQQFHLRVEKGKKLDFIKSIFDVCEMTQTFIFVNSKDFASKIDQQLRFAKYHSFVLHSKLDKKDRDDVMDKFRKQEINVLITTNMIARGIDVPEAQLIINYDVPTDRSRDGKIYGDTATYQHRIGRTGRFGSKGIALSIYDRDLDEECLM